MKFLVIVVLFIVNILETESENILYIAAFGSPSHHIWNRELAIGLVEKQYNLTMLTYHTKEEHPSGNLTYITIEGFNERLSRNFDMRKATEVSVLGSIKMMYDFAELGCIHNMESKSLKTLLNYPRDFFSLIIIDTTLTQCMYPILEIFNSAAVVGVNMLPPLLSNSFGNQIYASYMPYFSAEFSSKMSFSERMFNVIYVYAEYFYNIYISQPRQFKAAQKGFGDIISPLEETEKRINLVLTNTDPILNYPMALPPHIIPVGGLHIKPAKNLPKDLEVIFSKAQHGVILFSLGTNVKSDQLSLATRKAFLEAFAKLPQIVFWKFESAIDELPENVIVRKWLPQREILGHPKTKLFISHCGGFSSQEAMYHGVPVVGIPFLIDQYSILRIMVERNVARSLYYWNLTTENIYESVTDVLNNPIYRENMQLISKRYKDQPQTALEKAIFWIEHVIRHGSSDHLVPYSRYLPSYQLANLDVLIFFGFVLILPFLLILFIAQFVVWVF